MIVFCFCRNVTIVDLSKTVLKEKRFGRKQAELLIKRKLIRKNFFALFRELLIEIIVKIGSSMIS